MVRVSSYEKWVWIPGKSKLLLKIIREEMVDLTQACIKMKNKNKLHYKRDNAKGNFFLFSPTIRSYDNEKRDSRVQHIKQHHKANIKCLFSSNYIFVYALDVFPFENK